MRRSRPARILSHRRRACAAWLWNAAERCHRHQVLWCRHIVPHRRWRHDATCAQRVGRTAGKRAARPPIVEPRDGRGRGAAVLPLVTACAAPHVARRALLHPPRHNARRPLRGPAASRSRARSVPAGGGGNGWLIGCDECDRGSGGVPRRRRRVCGRRLDASRTFSSKALPISATSALCFRSSNSRPLRYL